MQPTTEMQFGRDDSPTITIASAFADGQVTITVQNQEVPGHACDNELTLGQTIQLRDFLNRHIDSLALAATGADATRSSDDPTSLPAVSMIEHRAMGGELLGMVPAVEELPPKRLPLASMRRHRPGQIGMEHSPTGCWLHVGDLYSTDEIVEADRLTVSSDNMDS